MIFINFILAILFWTMVDEAVADGRNIWAFTYLLLSAMNGAAILTEFFQEHIMKDAITFTVCILGFFGLLTFITVYNETMREECRLAAIKQNYSAVEVQAICK